jgi:hypothetical protein
VDFLKRFIPERGKILPRRISQVSAKDQRRDLLFFLLLLQLFLPYFLWFKVSSSKLRFYL